MSLENKILLKRRYLIGKVAEALYYAEHEITNCAPKIYSSMKNSVGTFHLDESHKVAESILREFERIWKLIE